MKFLIASALAIFSLQALALDLGEKHAVFCSSAEVSSQKDQTDSCRITLGLLNATSLQGTCTGKFMDVIPCATLYVASAQGAAMQIICGADPQNPLLDQVVEAKPLSYNIAAVVSKADGSEVVVNDPALHTIFESSMMTLTLSKTQSAISGSVTLNMQSGEVQLTEVTCN